MSDTTTIRLTLSAKHALEKLRLALEKSTRRKVTQQEAAQLAFEAVARDPGLLADAQGWSPLPKKARKVFQAMQADYGDWSVSEIDDVVADQTMPARKAK